MAFASGVQTPSAEDIIRLLRLVPHPKEGGWFVETYRSTEGVDGAALPPRFGGQRALSTAIYYLLTPETCSQLHRLASDEVFHFYVGDPVEMLQLPPNGKGKVITLGSDIVAGQRPQLVVPAGTWQGARLAEGGRLALLGCTVSPGFDYRDYEHGRRSELVAEHPEFAELINCLTRSSEERLTPVE